MLDQKTKDSMILLNQEIPDWKEAIRVSGQLLVDEGYAEPRYIDGMIDSVLEYGPYIVLFTGFALAHAASDKGALETGLSFVTLKEPINFGHEDYDPVRLVACMSTKDSESHMAMLSELAETMSDNEILDKLCKATTNEEFLKILKGE